MSRRRGRKSLNLGEAISLEDALSVMVVIFVLFVLFMVPLVNLGKLKMDKVEEDSIWKKIWIHVPTSNQCSPYNTALGFGEGWRVNSFTKNKQTILVSASRDSLLWVIEHNKSSGNFKSIKVEKFQTAILVREGVLVYSQDEGEYFVSESGYLHEPDSLEKVWVGKIKTIVTNNP